jgi:hypothetical protein
MPSGLRKRFRLRPATLDGCFLRAFGLAGVHLNSHIIRDYAAALATAIKNDFKEPLPRFLTRQGSSFVTGRLIAAMVA